ncbi:MAG TPA: Asp-tRNA(Asn)/Glu-tRNA(Gln) amidotransferase GatCAB subunit A, partial [Opitutae bacterium]|nr:Asp-tRNA(Asn)/Glu-tRNA(Gln) amidotransferase GatCAB subunit A [Opitutae bacterium]
MSDLHFKTITELAAMLEAGDTTSVAITQAVIDRTAAVDDRVKAFLASDADDALAQAEASDARRAAGKSLGPLDGIPIGIKDTLAVKDQPLRCASKMLENYVSPYDATCITKLREAGAVIWGRLNMDEFAMG